MTIPTDPTHNAFLYLINGEMELESQRSLKSQPDGFVLPRRQ